MFDGLGSSAQHIKAGRIKALMVAGNKRNPAFPDVPSAAEVGLPDYTVTTWYGLWAPKGTPADVQATHRRGHEEGAGHRRAEGHLGQQRRRDPEPHDGAPTAASSAPRSSAGPRW